MVLKRPASQSKEPSKDLSSKLDDLKKRKKELQAKIVPWQQEQKRLNGDKKPTVKKSDPIYADYQEYLQVVKQI